MCVEAVEPLYETGFLREMRSLPEALMLQDALTSYSVIHKVKPVTLNTVPGAYGSTMNYVRVCRDCVIVQYNIFAALVLYNAGIPWCNRSPWFLVLYSTACVQYSAVQMVERLISINLYQGYL